MLLLKYQIEVQKIVSDLKTGFSKQVVLLALNSWSVFPVHTCLKQRNTTAIIFNPASHYVIGKIQEVQERLELNHLVLTGQKTQIS